MNKIILVIFMMSIIIMVSGCKSSNDAISKSEYDRALEEERRKTAKALRIAEREREHANKLGNDHRDTLRILNEYAMFYRDKGCFDDAELLYQLVLKRIKILLGTNHPDTLLTMNDLVTLYSDQKLYEKAEPLCLKALEGYRRVFGNDHPDTLTSINNLAKLYQAQGRYKEAEPLARELVERTPKDNKEYNARKELLDQIREKLSKEESAVGESSEK